MIQVIDGKRYNTKTATRIFRNTNSYFVNDFHYRETTLYLTKNGAWFLYHCGGALSDMAVSVGKASGGSSAIESVDADDAYGFLEAHSDEDEALAAMEQYFADRITDA